MKFFSRNAGFVLSALSVVCFSLSVDLFTAWGGRFFVASVVITTCVAAVGLFLSIRSLIFGRTLWTKYGIVLSLWAFLNLPTLYFTATKLLGWR